jgi:CheY-like chemotaxis protein
MIIDDSGIDAFISQKMIQNYGFAEKIYTYNSSASAIEFFKNFELLPELPHTLLPNIILLDLNMPNQDGFEFINELSKLSNSITDNIKIAFLSSSNSTEDIEKSKTFSKVINYIVKPLTFQHLSDIQEMLTLETQ